MMSFDNPLLYAGLIALIGVVAVLAFVGPRVKNSPWLYVTAFGLMSCIGIVAIKPKFDRRERGIENKYIGRQETAKYFAEEDKVDTSGAKNPSHATSLDNSTQLRNAPSPGGPNYKLPPDENAKTVNFLLVFSAGATILGAGMLVYTMLQEKPENLAPNEPDSCGTNCLL